MWLDVFTQKGKEVAPSQVYPIRDFEYIAIVDSKSEL